MPQFWAWWLYLAVYLDQDQAIRSKTAKIATSSIAALPPGALVSVSEAPFLACPVSYQLYERVTYKTVWGSQWPDESRFQSPAEQSLRRVVVVCGSDLPKSDSGTFLRPLLRLAAWHYQACQPSLEKGGIRFVSDCPVRTHLHASCRERTGSISSLLG